MSISQTIKDLAVVGAIVNAARAAGKGINSKPQQAPLPIEDDGRPVYELTWKEKTLPTPHRTARKHQIYRDHITRITKLTGNDNIPVRTRIEKLFAMGREYMTGYPFKNNAELMNLNVDGVPVLARVANAAADQLLSIEKIRAGKGRDSDKGKINQ